MMLTAAGVILCGWLPGALLFRLPVGGRDSRAALTAEERAFWAIVLSVVWSLVVVLVLAFYDRYQFERLLIVNAIAAALVAAIGRTRLRYTAGARRATPQTLIPCALVALAAWLYLPPAEYVMGGKDPGTYLNEGIQIAQRGGLTIVDPVVASVPAPLRDLFFPSHGRPTYYGVRFMGFFVQDPARGVVVGQFPHLFPASVAVGYGLNGLSGARQAVLFWAVLGLLAVYFVGARLIGPWSAGAAVALLAINVIEVWFARYPNAEVAMQALLFAAMLAFGRALDGPARFFGPLAGLLLGLQLFLRYDAVLAIGAFSAAATLERFAGRRIGWGFWVVLVASSALGLVYLAGPMRAYSEWLFAYTSARGGWWLVAAGIGAIAGGYRLARSEVWAARVRRWLPAALAAVLALLAVYGYFFREPVGRTAAHDAYALRSFAWYVTPWALLGSIAGALTLLYRRFWTDPAFFLTAAVYSVFFFYKIRIVPDHFWSARRFLAATLPALMLGLAGLAAALVQSDAQSDAQSNAASPRAAAGPTERRPVTVALTVLLTAAMLVPVAVTFWRASTPVRRHVEYAGIIPQLESLAGRLGDRDLVVVESRNASDTHVLALPLAYIYARNVIVLDTPRPPKPAFETFVDWARTRYDNVFFLGGGGTDLLSRRLTAEPVVSERFQIPEYMSLREAYPTGVRRKEFDYGLYRLISTTTAPTGPVSLAIGVEDDLFVVRFHAKERRADGLSFRWTTARSWVVLPGFDRAAREVTVWLSSGGRPRNAPPARVTVAFDEHVLGTVAPTDDVQPFTWPLPTALVEGAAARDEPPRLQLTGPTWNPRDSLGVGDTRDLGVLVTRVDVR